MNLSKQRQRLQINQQRDKLVGHYSRRGGANQETIYQRGLDDIDPCEYPLATPCFFLKFVILQ